MDHLLQPIRDLAKNWNINIAVELEDYLDQLDSLSIEYENSTLNFSQAALMIQNSATIYSRKVEYLHTLVYQTLHHFTKSKEKNTKIANNDNEDPVEEEKEEDMTLSLIESLHIANNITMKKEKMKECPSRNAFQGAMMLMGSLIPDERDHGETFKLLTCDLTKNGALVLDASVDEDQGQQGPQEIMHSPVAYVQHDQEEGAAQEEYGGILDSGMDHNDDGMESDDGMENEPMHEMIMEEDHNPVEESVQEFVEEEEVWEDPWAPLDAFSTVGKAGTAQPFRIGKTYRKKRRPLHTNRPVGETVEEVHVKNIPLTGSISHYFDVIWKMEKKRARIQRKALQEKTPNVQVDLPILQHDQEEGSDGWEGGMVEQDDDGYDEDSISPDFLDSQDMEFSNGLTLDNAFEQAADPSYEQLCRSHANEFMKGAEKYTKETDLSRQVAKWEGKLNPILEEESLHPPFDIHDCGGKIVSLLQTEEDSPQESSDNLNFSHVVDGLDQYQVCRMFLATLQLANNGNVALHHGKSSLEQSSVPFCVELLSSDNCYASIQLE